MGGCGVSGGTAEKAELLNRETLRFTTAGRTSSVEISKIFPATI
jgi:hypothetical protein